MERIEEFTGNGKNFLYLDLAGLRTNDEFMKVIEVSKPVIRSYEGRALYTIANIESVTFDSKTKKISAEWMEHNKPYVECCVIIGVDSIRQIMVNAISILTGRKNILFASTREEAVELILKRG